MNKTALILGGTGGIGTAIADLLSKNNIDVYATYFNSKKNHELLNTFKNCKLLKCDIRNEEDIKNVITTILNNNQKIDIVINTTTGKLKLKLFEQISPQEFLEDIETILIGAINLFKQIIPIMKKNKSGIIINFLTAAINNPPRRMSSYITAKSGLHGLTNCLSIELDPFNIKVIGISPSFVNTKLINIFPSKLLELEREKLPEKEFIQPQEIARIVLAIINNEQKYISGENIILYNNKDIEKNIRV